jgi:hypothetical protein
MDPWQINDGLLSSVFQGDGLKKIHVERIYAKS